MHFGAVKSIKNALKLYFFDLLFKIRSFYVNKPIGKTISLVFYATFLLSLYLSVITLCKVNENLYSSTLPYWLNIPA